MLLRRLKGINLFLLPVGALVPAVVKLAMMKGAKGDRPFVAGFEAPGTGLREGEMMGVAGHAPADEAGLSGNVFEVFAISDALWCANGKQ